MGSDGLAEVHWLGAPTRSLAACGGGACTAMYQSAPYAGSVPQYVPLNGGLGGCWVCLGGCGCVCIIVRAQGRARLHLPHKRCWKWPTIEVAAK